MPETRSDTAFEIFRTAGAYYFLKDLNGKYSFVNAAVCQLFNTTAAQIVGQTDDLFFDLSYSREFLDNDHLVTQHGQEIHAEEHVRLRSGEVRVFWSIKLPLRDEKGVIQGLAGIASDITAARRDTDKLIKHNEVLSSVLGNVDAYIYMKGADGSYLYANQKVAELYGRTLQDIIGRTDDELFPAVVAARLRQFDMAVLKTGSRIAREELLVDSHHNERHFWSIKLPIQLPGAPTGLIGFSTEITELLALRKSLETERTTDILTGLSNRQRFEAELDVDLAMAKRDGRQLVVVVVDLDQFKYVNNSLGQDTGDLLLKEIAARLKSHPAIDGSVARMFGDEFVYSCLQFSSVEQVASAVEQVRQDLMLPYPVRDNNIQLSVSIGVALFPEDGQSSASLISHAETAMYYAKDRGRDRCQFYASALGQELSLRLELERDLRAAVAKQDFALFYQPKIKVNGQLNGFEALIRWHRPGHGMVSPAVFIPLAEQIGLINAIGAWVVEQACRQMAQWRQAGFGDIQVAVNMSLAQLQSPDFIGWLSALRHKYLIVDHQLEMEVTESMMMEDPEQAIIGLSKLSSSGINLAIDDFGTGYSSMAYLKRIPVNTLKLDKVFVDQVDTDQRDADICAGIIALAHKLGLMVVAEGVETQQQRDVLLQLEIDVIQGYFYSRPLPENEATVFLQQILQ